MKLPCNVTQDLLPLYHDGVCSQESRTMVEEHLSSCQSCQKLLDDLNTQPLPEAYIDDAAALKALKKQWGKSLAKSFAKGLGLACLVCALIWGAWYGLTQWMWIPVSPDRLNVHDVSLLSTGQVTYTIDVTDGKAVRSIYTKLDSSEDQAVLYYVPSRPVLPGKISSVEQRHNKYLLNVENLAVENDQGETVDISAVYVGPVGNGILIWEKGMELPPASQEQENYWAGEFSNPFNSYLNG